MAALVLAGRAYNVAAVESLDAPWEYHSTAHGLYRVHKNTGETWMSAGSEWQRIPDSKQGGYFFQRSYVHNQPFALAFDKK